MKARATWTEKMKFDGECDGHLVKMDAKPPFGSNSAPTPKELLAVALGGCTGMDVVALMKKHKQPLESFEVRIETNTVEKTQPPIFKDVHLTFIFQGSLDVEKVLEAVHLSQTKYCAVSGMIAKTVPIHYTIFLNEKPIGTGETKFEI